MNGAPQGEAPEAVENRQPPHDVEAEAAVISSVLVDPNGYDRISDYLTPSHFYSEAHRRIYEAAGEVSDAGKPIDIVTVATHLRDRGRLAQVGGSPYLTQVINAAPAVANIEAYARTVYDLGRMRDTMFAAKQIESMGYARTIAPGAFVDYADRLIGNIADSDHRSDMGEGLGKIMGATYDEVSRAYSAGKPPGIPTGLHELDDITMGLHPDEFTIVAARPGVGKTAAMLALGHNVAATIPPLFRDDQIARPQGVLIFSLEMPRDRLALRMWAAESGVALRSLRSGQVQANEWPALIDAAKRLSKLSIHIDDTPALHAARIPARIRRMKRAYAEKGVDLVLVLLDYIQIAKGDGASREQQVAYVSSTLREVAKEEHVAVVGLAQLSRDVEKRAQGNKRPVLSDLRESGQMEQDAQNVIFLYRPEMAGEQVDPEEHGLCEWIVAKQRDGDTRTAKTRYEGRITKFSNL